MRLEVWREPTESALTFYIAIMKSLPKIHAAWVMSDRSCWEGGSAIAGTAASASLVATVTGQPVGSPEKLGRSPTHIQRYAVEDVFHSFS